jgi:hypothetical protein
MSLKREEKRGSHSIAGSRNQTLEERECHTARCKKAWAACYQVWLCVKEGRKKMKGKGELALLGRTQVEV